MWLSLQAAWGRASLREGAGIHIPSSPVNLPWLSPAASPPPSVLLLHPSAWGRGSGCSPLISHSDHSRIDQVWSVLIKWLRSHRDSGRLEVRV